MHIGKKALVMLTVGLFLGYMSTWAYIDEGAMGVFYVIIGLFTGLGVGSVLGLIAAYIGRQK